MKLHTKSARAKVDIDDAWVMVRAISFREMVEIRDQCEVSVNTENPTEDARTFDQQEFAKRMWVAAVTDWGGNLQDINGKKIPCTEDTKAEVFEMNIEFVNEVQTKASKIFATVRERDEKNSQPGANGTSLQEEPLATSAER